MAELGDEPEVATEGGEPPARRGSHFLLPRPLPVRPPPAPPRLAAARLLFPGRTESGSVSPPGRRRASPSPAPPAAAAAAAAAARPAPRRRAQWRRRERAADPQRRVARSTTRPRPRRPPPAPGADTALHSTRSDWGILRAGGPGRCCLRLRDPRAHPPLPRRNFDPRRDLP
ncbi:hypothetical protein VULLAG_LOCUS4566 [Vulpes lagopus]